MSRKSKGIALALQIIGASGKPSNRKLQATAAETLKQVLIAAGVDPKGKSLALNGEPATQKTKVRDGDKITVTERPEGS